MGAALVAPQAIHGVPSAPNLDGGHGPPYATLSRKKPHRAPRGRHDGDGRHGPPMPRYLGAHRVSKRSDLDAPAYNDHFAQRMQSDLFATGDKLPEGFVYQPEFLSHTEEAALLDIIRALPLSEAKYKQFTARRRTLSYGSQYDFSANALMSAPALPSFLDPLRVAAAQWIGVQSRQFVHALVIEYPPGAPLGWHRDVPDFEAIVGVSLGGTCVMRLRPYKPGERQDRRNVIAITLEPRSAYCMRGPARWGWQHCIVATRELRYSITLRTARSRRA